MKKPKMKTPVDRNKHPKSFKEIVLEHLKKTHENVASIKKDVRKIIEEEVRKEIGDKIDMIEALYKRTIVIQDIWFDKGLITREEIDKKYEEMKLKKKQRK